MNIAPKPSDVASESAAPALLPVINEDMSLRLALLKFLSCIAVIYVHSYTPQYDYFAKMLAQLPAFNVTVLAVSGYIARVSLAIFFAVSGYIYFAKQYDCSLGQFAKRKAAGTLVPYLLWNTITLGYIFAVQSWDFARGYFPANKLVDQFSALNWLEAYIGWGNYWYPYLYPLWFLPFLFITFVLVHLLRKFFNQYDWLIWMLVALHIITSTYNPLVNIFMKFGPCMRIIYAMAFFTMGKLFLKYQRQLDSKFVLFISGAAYAGVAAVRFGVDIKELNWDIVSIYIGLVFFFSLSQVVARCSAKIKKLIVFSAGFLFVIYLTHEFAITALSAIIYPRMPLNSLVLVPLYLLLPWVLAAMQITAGYVLKKLMPKVYGLLFGGR